MEKGCRKKKKKKKWNENIWYVFVHYYLYDVHVVMGGKNVTKKSWSREKCEIKYISGTTLKKTKNIYIYRRKEWQEATGKVAEKINSDALFISFVMPTPMRITVYFLSHLSFLLFSFFIFFYMFFFLKGLYLKHNLFNISPDQDLFITSFFCHLFNWSCGHFSFSWSHM